MAVETREKYIDWSKSVTLFHNAPHRVGCKPVIYGYEIIPWTTMAHIFFAFTTYL